MTALLNIILMQISYTCTLVWQVHIHLKPQISVVQLQKSFTNTGYFWLGLALTHAITDSVLLREDEDKMSPDGLIIKLLLGQLATYIILCNYNKYGNHC